MTGTRTKSGIKSDMRHQQPLGVFQGGGWSTVESRLIAGYPIPSAKAQQGKSSMISLACNFVALDNSASNYASLKHKFTQLLSNFLMILAHIVCRQYLSTTVFWMYVEKMNTPLRLSLSLSLFHPAFCLPSLPLL